MENKTDRTLLNIGVISFLLGLGLWIVNQYKLAMQFCWKIKSVEFLNVSIKDFKFRVGILIRNFSNVDALINGFDIDVFINDIKLTKTLSDQTQEIKKKTTSLLNVDFALNLQELFKTDIGKVASLTKIAVDVKSKPESVKYRFVGTVSIKVLNIPIKKLKIDITMTHKEMMESDPEAFVCDIYEE